MAAYYNEIDPYAAQWLRNLIEAGLIPGGEVDERDIREISPADLHGFHQCHFFAGIGGWAYACRLAGWPDDRPLWTGSCPCQPFSVAGKGEGQTDPRHLWPEFFRLIGACRPDVVMGEQVAAAVGKHWLDGVHSDLEGIGYACRAAVVPACAVDAPHRRDRLWFVADSDRDGPLAGIDCSAARHGNPAAADDRKVALADANELSESQGRQQRSGKLGRTGGDPVIGAVVDAAGERRGKRRPSNAVWERHNTSAAGARLPDGHAIVGADGKARRVEPGVRLLAHGVPARVGRLRAYGNAIVPQVAAEVIGAYLDAEQMRAA